jgi:hypothetical protein
MSAGSGNSIISAPSCLRRTGSDQHLPEFTEVRRAQLYYDYPNRSSFGRKRGDQDAGQQIHDPAQAHGIPSVVRFEHYHARPAPSRTGAKPLVSPTRLTRQPVAPGNHYPAIRI